MKDQILNFVVENPIALVVVLLLLPFSFAVRYRRMKRRSGNLNDHNSKALLVVGGIVAALIIGGFLYWS